MMHVRRLSMLALGVSRCLRRTQRKGLQLFWEINAMIHSVLPGAGKGSDWM